MGDRELDKNTPSSVDVGSKGGTTQGNYSRGNPSPSKSSTPSSFLARSDQKTLIYLVGLVLALLNGFLLNKFSQEFKSKFTEHIEIYKYRIKANEEKLTEQEKRIRDVEIRLGGKK